MATALAPETVLKEMSRLWISLGRKASEQGEGVLRACAMTLIAVTPESGDGAAVSEAIGEIMRDHPSRAIVLRLSDEPRPPEANVVAQCWMPFGRREQICCEQVEIAAGLDGLANLKPFLLALVAPDLPVVIWVRGALPLDGALKEIAPLAGKVIVDTAAWADPRTALQALAASMRPAPLLADLSWTRLTRWREMVAQMFENCTCGSLLQKFSDIEIEHGGDSIPPAAFYLAAWLARGLGWTPDRARTVRFLPAAGSPAGSVHGLRMRAGDFEVHVRRTEETAIELIAGDLRSRAVLPRPTEAALLREELGILGRDRMFEEVLAVAAELAGTA